MRAVQEQPVNSDLEYKDLRSKVDELMEKSTAQKFSIKKRVENPQLLKSKEPPTRTIDLKDMISMDNPSSTAIPMASAITSPMAT